ncbi:MAG: hypothetical protein QGG34_07255 [SAR202 cluster bacterium]|nr:hypothetical protein [SAR202 cluster bacterium]MDP6301059.1 hypothetical protein [SAR202 cluster bacterium]MDP7104483.1 hypothetical protein [SAR202 cluster bacterium]MDP7226146.1 hypothetical protein [SAR202 cluster bacterium]HJO81026.1 hypothetical protein [SAR202 cluster bacterium]
MKRILFIAIGVLAMSMPARGVVEANGTGVHIGSLSDTATYAVIGAFAAVVGLFVLMFVLRWREVSQSEQADPEDAVDPESEDEG